MCFPELLIYQHQVASQPERPSLVSESVRCRQSPALNPQHCSYRAAFSAKTSVILVPRGNNTMWQVHVCPRARTLGCRGPLGLYHGPPKSREGRGTRLPGLPAFAKVSSGKDEPARFHAEGGVVTREQRQRPPGTLVGGRTLRGPGQGTWSWAQAVTKRRQRRKAQRGEGLCACPGLLREEGSQEGAG